MSLMVWLQLNGDLENKGYHFTNITSNDITVNNNGKIGKCYSFNGSSSYIALLTPPLSNDTTEFSYCCWVNPNSTAAGCLLSNRTSTNPTGFSIFINNSGKILFDTGSRLEYTQSVFTNTWTHLAFTWKKNGEKKIYINGTLMSQTTTSTPPTIANATKTLIGASQTSDSEVNGYYFDGYLNDVRIYSHCLSAAEVHEISQGLALHYKLDFIDNGILGENIWTVTTNTISDSSGYGRTGTITGTATISDSEGRYSSMLSMDNSNTSNRIELTGDFPFTNPLSVSFWIKTDLSNQIIFACPQIEFGILSHIGYVSPSNAGGFVISSLFKTNDWNHICAIRDNTTYRLYVNGTAAEQTGANNSITHSATSLWLLNCSGNSAYAADVDLSDFRIYCTALTAADVEVLYRVGAKVDNKGNLHAYEFNEDGYNKLKKNGVFYNYATEPYIQLADGSCWKLMLFHYVDDGNNLFTSSNASYSDEFGLYSRLQDIDNFTYNDKYEYYVVEDGVECRWTQINPPMTSTSVVGFTSISGSPYGGICKRNNDSLLASSNNGTLYCACGCQVSVNDGIPGFGGGTCKQYLALYTRISAITFRTATGVNYANNLIEF